jgi:hypothetical protein
LAQRGREPESRNEHPGLIGSSKADRRCGKQKRGPSRSRLGPRSVRLLAERKAGSAGVRDPVRGAERVSGQAAAGVRPVVTDAPVHRRDRRSAWRVVVDLAVGLRLGDGAKAAPPV